jgi:hypothetical protein
VQVIAPLVAADRIRVSPLVEKDFRARDFLLAGDHFASGTTSPKAAKSLFSLLLASGIGYFLIKHLVFRAPGLAQGLEFRLLTL